MFANILSRFVALVWKSFVHYAPGIYFVYTPSLPSKNYNVFQNLPPPPPSPLQHMTRPGANKAFLTFFKQPLTSCNLPLCTLTGYLSTFQRSFLENFWPGWPTAFDFPPKLNQKNGVFLFGIGIPSKPYSIHSVHFAIGSRMNRIVFHSFRKRKRSQKNARSDISSIMNIPIPE